MTDLIVEDIQQTLGATQILHGASLTAQRGEIAGLLGASGSGKTTLLRVIAGLEQPDSGRISIGGKLVVDGTKGLCLPPEQRDIGLVFQSYALWPHRTVLQNVGYGLKLRKIDHNEINKRSLQMLDRLGLDGLGDRFPHQLSGGQQQRVALCRALVYNPAVLLLDEPLSNLDAKLRDEARFWIRRIILELEICAVVVTHDQLEALSMCDEILLLSQGRIVETGKPQDIYGQPKTLTTAQFMGVNNVLPGRVVRTDGTTATVEGHGWSLSGLLRSPVAVGEEIRAVVRVDRSKVSDVAATNTLPMQLEASVYMGEYWDYLLRADGLEIRARGTEELQPAPVWCEFPQQDVWIFAAS